MIEKTLGEIGFLKMWEKDNPQYKFSECGYEDDWEDAAQAIVASHEARRWQAMESAPKESDERIAAGIEPRCPMLQLVVEGEVVNGYFDLYCAPGGRGYTGGSGWCNQAGEEINEPTHWAPIPAPPQEVE